MPYQLAAMNRLPQSVRSEFSNGNFMGRLTDKHNNADFLDKIHESTENKDLKGSGGIIGLTCRENALLRWFYARPVTAEFSHAFRDNFTHSTSKAQSNHCSSAEVNRWNSDLQKLLHLFDGTFHDPFAIQEMSPHLINISTGQVADAVTEDSLLSMFDKGQKIADQFVKQRLSVTHEKSFYETLPKVNIHTMTMMNAPMKVKSKTIKQNGDTVYLRLLAINVKKCLPMYRVMSFENSPTPLSLFHDTGKMQTCTKAHLMHKLEGLLPTKIQQCPPATAIIYEGHYIMKKLKAPGLSGTMYCDMANDFQKYVLNFPISQIHVIFDQYWKYSTKSSVRFHRTGGRNLSPSHHISSHGRIPQDWVKLLERDVAKSDLAKLYTTHLFKHAGPHLTDQQHMFVSGGTEDNTCINITSTSVSTLPEMICNHEEADTRIIFHAVHCTSEHDVLIVETPDTDVIVLLVHHRASIKAREIYVKMGTNAKNQHTDNGRYIPIHQICNALSQPQINIMIYAYCLSGCDTVSSFTGIGKKKVFNALIKCAHDHQDLVLLSSQNAFSHGLSAAVRFMGQFYTNKCVTSFNELRADLVDSSKPIHPSKLPPTMNSICI